MQIGRSQIQILMIRAATAAFLMSMCEQNCATKVYEQSKACDADRFIKMNFKRHKQSMHRFTGHQKRNDREHHGAGKSAQHPDLSCAETETCIAGLCSRKIVGRRRYQKCQDMCAHV